MVEGVDSTKQLLTLARESSYSSLFAPWDCALVLAIVYWGSGLRGPWLAMWGVMVMASAVGSVLGLVVDGFSRTWIVRPRWSCYFVSPMIVLGGWLWPVAGSRPPIRLAASAMPSRWAFEDLLLLEVGLANPQCRRSWRIATPTEIDIAESYFPADSERMGPADARLWDRCSWAWQGSSLLFVTLGELIPELLELVQAALGGGVGSKMVIKR